MVINQLLGEYKCNNLILKEYLEEVKSLLKHFANIIISHIPMASNEVANELAQHASGYKIMIPNVNSIENGVVAIVNYQSSILVDWRQELI